MGKVGEAVKLASSGGGAAAPTEAERAKLEKLVVGGDEASWRMAFTRAEGGECERKLGQALNIFADVQERLEGIVREAERERGRGGVGEA